MTEAESYASGVEKYYGNRLHRRWHPSMWMADSLDGMHSSLGEAYEGLRRLEDLAARARQEYGAVPKEISEAELGLKRSGLEEVRNALDVRRWSVCKVAEIEVLAAQADAAGDENLANMFLDDAHAIVQRSYDAFTPVYEQYREKLWSLAD